ncbi:MAG TPA: AbgT family transporter [Pirellulaceae bacterium]|nr:AbgT family transporter [Pirellulaceae bacterium]
MANDQQTASTNWVVRFLNMVEWAGNKLPDPAMLFIVGIVVVWLLSFALSYSTYTTEIEGLKEPVVVEVVNMLSLERFALFLSGMVSTFVNFPPLGIVLVALLGVGVAEHSGFISAILKSLLRITPKMLLTPMLIMVAIVSHTAADAGYVLVIPVGGIMFYAAGRHPLAGIAAAFAGVSGGFSANFVVSGIDPLLAGLTQSGASIENAAYQVNPLCNYYFTAVSSLLIIGLGWFITDRVVEPKLQATQVDGDPQEMPKMPDLSRRDVLAMFLGLGLMFVFLTLIVVWATWESSALRGPSGSLFEVKSKESPGAPLMNGIVPLIFFLFFIPGVAHGFIAGTFTSHRDVIKGMAKSMETMAYYLVLVFFTALFVEAFRESQIGRLFAVKGAAMLQGLPTPVVISGIVVLTAFVNLFIGSASSKWGMLAPIFVPMLMYLGISPEFTQAAYRVGDSTTNIITPMMPYFPLVVVYCQRYVKSTGIGTVASMMLPFSISFLVLWTLFLLLFWGLNVPLGIDAPYLYDR